MTLLLLLACAPDTTLLVVSEDPSMPTDWAPGDPIPGWPTYDCSEGDRGDVLESVLGAPLEYYRDPVLVMALEKVGPPFHDEAELVCSSVYFTAGECLGEACAPDDFRGFVNELHVVGADSCAESATPHAEDLTGWIRQAPDPFDPDPFDDAGYILLKDPPFFAGAEAGSRDTEPWFGWWAGVDTCLGELRPDRVRGVVRLALGEGGLERLYPATWLLRTPPIFRLVFDWVLPTPCSADHRYAVAYRDGRSSEEPLTALELYDTIWPWDSIEDPAVRDRLYELYKPECD